jgi:hypothetical protein
VISKAKDITWQNPLAAIWSSVECNTGILCSCLPTLRSCVSRLFPKLLGTFRSNGSESNQKNEPSSEESASSKPAEPTTIAMPEYSPGRSGRRKISFDALGHGLTGRSDPMQRAYAYSGNDSSSEEHELDVIPLPAGDERQIQVTTVVAQDVQHLVPDDDRIMTDDEDGTWTGRGARTMRAVSRGSHE